MTINYVTLGKMAAEFKEVCARIDQAAAEAEGTLLRDAFAALLAGDVTDRDRKLDRITGENSVRIACDDAKFEAWFRIGEKYGIPRETAERWLDELTGLAGRQIH